MKVALIADSLPGVHPNWSGAELVCLRLGERLQKFGQEVIFATPDLGKEYADKVHQINLPLLRRGIISGIVPLDLPAIIQSVAFLRQTKPDLVHIHSKELFLPMWCAGMFLGIPVILTVLDYNLICPENTLRRLNETLCPGAEGGFCLACVNHTRPTGSAIMKKIRKVLLESRIRLYRHMTNKMAAIITLSNTSKNRLADHKVPPEKVHVSYYYELSAPTQSSNPAPQPPGPRVLFVGSWNAHKGLHVAIQAMSLVVKELPEARLVVVGHDSGTEYSQMVRDLLQESGLQKNVDILGQKPNFEVRQLIEESDLVIVPEQWPSDFGPVILVEALASGKPVVASRIGGIPEFVMEGETGLLATHNQPDEFAHKIIQLLQNPGEAHTMGKYAKESMQFLFNDDAIKNIIELYKSVIGNNDKK